jgi:hypothetical protein
MYFTRHSLGVLFYHLKGLKPEGGIRETGRSIAGMDELKDVVLDPHLISWNEAQERYHAMLAKIPKPDLTSLSSTSHDSFTHHSHTGSAG